MKRKRKRGRGRELFYFRFSLYCLRTKPHHVLCPKELLNTVHKPLGTVPARPASSDLPETTSICTLKVPKDRLIYTRSRQDMTWRVLNLNKVDFVGARGKEAVVASPTFNAVDVTDELRG